MPLPRIITSGYTSSPHTIDLDLWPEATVSTTTDLTVSGVSLTRLVAVCGTPCVHAGAAVIPLTGGLPSSNENTSVVVVRVLTVRKAANGPVVVITDANHQTHDLIWGETRLIGRASTARARIVVIARTISESSYESIAHGAALELPRDLRAGDLLVTPTRRSHMKEPTTAAWLAPLA